MTTMIKNNLQMVRLTLLPMMAAFLMVDASLQSARAQAIRRPLPRTATNAAIHYQRAMLFLSGVEIDKRELLLKPIWEIMTPETTDAELEKINELLVASRHAIRSALVGANQSAADFGLDVRQYVISDRLPHTHPMTDLGKLLALHGMQRQVAGRWADAAEIYLAILRMGRHMTHQTTLAEAFSGVEVLEDGYFTLAHWAPRCPDVALVEDVSHAVNAMAVDMINPAQILRSEAAITKLNSETMQAAYPDGAWAEIVLEALGRDVPMYDPAEMREAAIAAAVKAGVPKSAFDDAESFREYGKQLRAVYIELADQSAEVLTQKPPASIEKAQELFAKYESKLLPTERAGVLNTGKMAVYFAVHQAELDMARLVLAISAARTSDGFPANLAGVATRFGGRLPTSSYDSSPYIYEPLEGGKGFSLKVSAAKVGELDLPEIHFQYLPDSGN